MAPYAWYHIIFIITFINENDSHTNHTRIQSTNKYGLRKDQTQ